MLATRSAASTSESAQIQAQQPFGLGHKRVANLGNGKLESEALDHAQEQSHRVGRPNTFRDGALSLGALDETSDPRLVCPVNLREALLQAWILQPQMIREHKLRQCGVALHQSHMFQEHATEDGERGAL